MATTEDLAKQVYDLQQKQEALTTGHSVQSWTPELVKFLTVSLLVFTLASLALCATLLWRSKATGFHVLRVFGVITIIAVSALLLVVGYNDEQLTPIIGLFGAIAGYLLGKEKESPDTVQQ